MATIKQIINSVLNPRGTTSAGRASGGAAFTNQMGIGNGTGFQSSLNTPLSAPVGQGLTTQQTQKAYSTIRPASSSNPKPATMYGRSVGPVPMGSVLPSNMTRIIEQPQQPLPYQSGNSSNAGTQNYNTQPNDIYTQQYSSPTYSPKSVPSVGTNSISSFGAIGTGGKIGATSGDIMGSMYGYEKTPYERQQEEAAKLQADYYNKLANDNTTEESARNDALRLLQAEVNATDRLFADTLSRAQKVGDQRLAMDRSINFNAGGTGSSFANASQSRTMDTNLADAAQIENQKLAALQAINSKAIQLGNQMYTDKQNAKKMGVDAYLQAVNNQASVIENNTAKVATGMINSGIDIETLPKNQLETIATSLGTNTQRLVDTYNTLKKSIVLNKNIPASAQEYEYAKANGYTGSYNDYQTEDANRKALASGSGGSGLSSGDLNRLDGVITKYSKDEIVRQAQQVPMIKSIISTVRANPNSAANQLITLYTLVKNLDPNSAVREGELDLAQKTNTFFGKYGDKLTRLSKGRVLNPKATLELINGIETLSKEWEQSGNRKINQYQSQASALGLGNQFGNYIGNYSNNTQSVTEDQITKLRERGISDERIQQYIQSKSFNNVGSGTNQAVVIPQNIGSSRNQLAWRNNNPGNIRYVGQKGAVRGANGFAKFETPEAGFNELISLVNRRQSQGHTVSSFINQYAPSFENNTNAYLARIVKETGASPNTPLANVDPMAIARVIASHESGTKIYG